jgi:hypothetical protein
MLSLSKWKSVRPNLWRDMASSAVKIGLGVTAFFFTLWMLENNLDKWAFVFGVFTGLVMMLLCQSNEEQPMPQPDGGRPENWKEMIAERHNAELECTRMMAKRAELECRRLAREMEEEARYDQPDE